MYNIPLPYKELMIHGKAERIPRKIYGIRNSVCEMFTYDSVKSMLCGFPKK